MILGERIEWVMGGKYIGIERVGNSSMALLCDGKKKVAYDLKNDKVIPDFLKLDFLEEKKDKDFAVASKKKCFETKIGNKYFVLDNKEIIQKDKKGNTRIIDPSSCCFNAKDYEYKIYDLIVAGEQEETLYFVGTRSFEEYEHSGLFCFPIIDFQ